MITLNEFTKLDPDARRAYLTRHPDDTRFDPDTLDKRLPEFTPEYSETLRNLWPDWDKAHPPIYNRTFEEDCKRDDIDLTDRLYQTGFKEFDFTSEWTELERTDCPRTFAEQLFGTIGNTTVTILTAKNPETGESAKYRRVEDGVNEKWYKSTKLERETKNANNIKMHIADRMNDFITGHGSKGENEISMNDVEMMIDALRSKGIKNMSESLDSLIKDLKSSKEVVAIFDSLDYTNRTSLLIDCGRVHGILNNGYTVSGFIEQIQDKIDDILTNVEMYEIKETGKDRQEAEMQRFMEKPDEIGRMIVYRSAENVQRVSDLFSDLVDIEVSKPGRTLDSMIDASRYPNEGCSGYLAYPNNFLRAVETAHKEGRDQEIIDVYKNQIKKTLTCETTMSDHDIDATSNRLAYLFFEKATKEIESGEETIAEYTWFTPNSLFDVTLAAAKSTFTNEEVERTLDICGKHDYPGFYGFVTQTLSNFIANQSDEGARRIITAENPDREAGFMKTRAYLEDRIAWIKKEESQIEAAKRNGRGVALRKERLFRVKEKLVGYVEDRIRHIDKEDVDTFITPSEQKFIADACKKIENIKEESENKHSKDEDVLDDYTENAKDAKLKKCVVCLGKQVYVYATKNEDLDIIWSRYPWGAEIGGTLARATITLDTTTGHIYVGYNRPKDVPEEMPVYTRKYEVGMYTWRVDMTEKLGGPATPETAAKKVSECARMVMESFTPPTTYDRVKEIVDECNKIRAETKTFLGKDRGTALDRT